MSLARLLAALGLVAALAAPARAGWDPLKSAGQSLAGGVREALTPVIADVDTRIGARVDQVGGVASKLVSQVDKSLADRMTQVDQTLEKRILQVQLSAQAVTKGALDQVDDISRKRLAEASVLANGLVQQLDKTVKTTLSTTDKILKDRTADLGRLVNDTLAQADQVVAARIAQVDEIAGRRLGNVDVIATKQRLALEQTLVRVAILVGLVVFVVFALKRMWEAYGKAADAVKGQAPPSWAQAWRMMKEVCKPLLRQSAAAGVAVAVLLLLYQRLPLGAAHEAEELADRHKKGLTDSLQALDYPQVRFHASQLELLLPADGSYYQAMAAKAELLRDLLARPGLLASASGIAGIMDRVQAVERLLGGRPDPDVLVAKALVLWQVGQRRQDEHEAASLCARALRVAPAGFALEPLARAYVLAFLHAPWIPEGTPFGRDRASLAELQAVLAQASPDPLGTPLYAVAELDRLMRELDRASWAAYLDLIDAHAKLLADPGRARPLRQARTAAAQRVLDVWTAFDRELQEIPGLAANPAALVLFRLDDAVLTRSLWFLANPEADTVAPLLGDLGDKPDAVALKIRMAPPRVAWARRYAAALDQRPRDVVEFQESERWKDFEQKLRAFENARVAERLAEAARQPAAAAEPRRKAAQLAAELGIYVDRPGGQARAPLGLLLSAGETPSPALVQALEARRLQFL